MNGLNDGLAEHVCHDTLTLIEFQRLLAGCHIGAISPLRLQDILPAKFVVHLENRVLIDGESRGQLTDAGQLMTLAQDTQGNLIPNLVDDLPVDGNRGRWLDADENGELLVRF